MCFVTFASVKTSWSPFKKMTHKEMQMLLELMTSNTAITRKLRFSCNWLPLWKLSTLDSSKDCSLDKILARLWHDCSTIQEAMLLLSRSWNNYQTFSCKIARQNAKKPINNKMREFNKTKLLREMQWMLEHQATILLEWTLVSTVKCNQSPQHTLHRLSNRPATCTVSLTLNYTNSWRKTRSWVAKNKILELKPLRTTNTSLL
jgi:hypothetical protein